jgi:hypothetical protein
MVQHLSISLRAAIVDNQRDLLLGSACHLAHLKSQRRKQSAEGQHARAANLVVQTTGGGA